MRTLLAALFLFMAAPVMAEGVPIQGAGTFSCGKYLELRAEKNNVQDAIFASWIWGYMAGFNMVALLPTSSQLPDQPSTLSYVDKHCRDNPLDNVLIAANTLIRDLGGRRRGRK